MRRCAALGLLATLLVACGGGSRARMAIDERRGQLDGVHFGDTAARVRAVLGSPRGGAEFFPANGGAFTGPAAIPAVGGRPKPLRYDDVAYLVSPTTGVYAMTTVAGKAETRGGVSIGDDLDDVHSHYARVECAHAPRGEGDGYDWCRARAGGVRVFFGGDPIESITLTRLP